MAAGDKLQGIATAQTVTTADGTITTLMTYEVPADHTVLVKIKVTAQRYNDGETDEAYSYCNSYIFNKAGAAGAVLRATGTPVELDPAGTDWEVTVSASGNNVLVQATGTVAEDVRWFGNINVLDVEQEVSASSDYSPLTTSLELNNDAQDEYVDFGNVGVLDFSKTDPYSLGMWIKWDGVAAGYPMTKGHSAQGWHLQLSAGGSVSFWMMNGGSDWFRISNGAPGLSDGGWHHLVATYDGSNSRDGMTLYTDGTPLAPSKAGSDLTGDITNSNPMLVGALDAWASAEYIGKICHSSIHDKELSAAEVTTLYGGGVPQNLVAVGPTGNLVHWCTLGDGCAIGAGNCPDLSAENNDGTTVNVEGGDFVLDVPP